MRRLFRRIHEFFLMLLREHTAPGKVALAVLLGCMVGCTPLFGLHFPLCVGVALLFRLNKFIVYGAANLSIPPLIPLWGALSVGLGEALLHGQALGLLRADFSGAALPALAARFFWSWLVGGLLVGTAVGAAVAAPLYVVLRRRQRALAAQAAPGEQAGDEASDEAIGEAMGRASRRYAGLPGRFRYYARSKYRMDPCYRALCAHIPPGARVVDLGTGLGMLPVALGELGGGRRAVGVEWDEAKAHGGQHAARGLPGIEVVRGDIHQWALPSCDVVVLCDVLHYYDAEAQGRLLTRAAAVLPAGGLLLIRETDGALGRGWITRLIERLMVRLGWNRAPRVHFRRADDLIADVAARGFAVTRSEVAGTLHPGNVLLVARKG